MKRKEKQKVREKKARELQDFAAKSKRLECFLPKVMTQVIIIFI